MSRGRRHRRATASLRGWIREGGAEGLLVIDTEDGSSFELAAEADETDSAFEPEPEADETGPRSLRTCVGEYVDVEGLVFQRWARDARVFLVRRLRVLPRPERAA